MLKTLTLFLLLFIISPLQGQEEQETKILKGKILLSGEEAIGAKVYVIGTYLTTVTNFDGTFSFIVPNRTISIDITYCGSPLQEVIIPKCVRYFELDLNKWYKSKRYRNRLQKHLKKECRIRN